MRTGSQRLGLMLGALLVSVPVRAQLLHQYTFDTDARDAVGSANGVLVGGASISGGRLLLDGLTGFVQFGSKIVPGSGSYTVAFFAQRNVFQNAFVEFISQGVSGGPGFFIGTAPDGTLRVTDQVLSTGLAAPAVGTFAHYALAVDAAANVSRFYVNGTLVGSVNFAIATGLSGSNTRFGRQFDPFTEFFNGVMDDVRIYGNALSANEIADIARIATVPEPASLFLFGVGAAALAVVKRRRRLTRE